MFERNRFVLIYILPYLMANGVAEACRYSVRDVGFVEIQPVPYRLYLFVDSASLDELVPSFDAAAGLALDESNVESEIVSLQTEPNHPARAFLEDLKSKDLPSALLVSPDENIDPLRVPIPKDPTPETAREMLEGIVTSKIRSDYLERMFEIYGLVIFAESDDPVANEAAMGQIKEAVDQTEEYMMQIPKPVNQPPELVRLPADGSEKVLRWSLGFEGTGVPQVAVLFGRGRKIGKVLSGADITRENLFEILSVIGLDCECGLDRSWMQGTRIPLVWNAETQQRAVRRLGFDPESPMTKIEISQILTHGGPGLGRGETTENDPFLGYSEHAVRYRELDVGLEDEERIQASRQPSEATPQGSVMAIQEPAQDGPSRISPLPGTVANPERVPFLWVYGLLGVVVLSIFLAGFYILLRARWREQ